MEQRPTYDLDAVKAVLASADTLAITGSALRTASALGFDRMGIAATLAGMQRTMFVKSMTTFADHRVWQDVYHVPAYGLVLYVKFQANTVTEFILVSFKER